MRKYTLGDHPEITRDFYADNAKFFSRVYKGNMPNLGEKIREVARERGKIIVIGENHTKCSIIASDIMLDKIQTILKGYIGVSIGNIENIEID